MNLDDTHPHCFGCAYIGPNGDHCLVADGFCFATATRALCDGRVRQCKRSGWRVRSGRFVTNLHSPSTSDWGVVLDGR